MADMKNLYGSCFAVNGIEDPVLALLWAVKQNSNLLAEMPGLIRSRQRYGILPRPAIARKISLNLPARHAAG